MKTQNEKAPQYKCSWCGTMNHIVNQCRCDPNNLPTKVSTKLAPLSDIVATFKNLLAIASGALETPDEKKLRTSSDYDIVEYATELLPQVERIADDSEYIAQLETAIRDMLHDGFNACVFLPDSAIRARKIIETRHILSNNT
jgi:hypothetical protein